MEDSISGEYVAKHKNNIVTAFKLLRKEVHGISLAIRINTPESESFNSDMEFLNFFNKYFHIEVIFILKINKLNINLINSELL